MSEIRRRPDKKGHYTNVFLAAPATTRLPWNSPTIGIPAILNGRNFGHLAYNSMDNIYNTCSAFIGHGVTINRPLRDGRMALIRTPDGISIELLQASKALPPGEPCSSMANPGFMVERDPWRGLDHGAAGVNGA